MHYPSPADLSTRSQSTSEAVNSIHELRNLLQHFIERNPEPYDRVEDAPQIQRRPSSTRQSIGSWTSSRIAFESVLSNSRIYRRALRVTSSDPDSTGWSVFSGLSLSDVSNISVFHLAICAAELSNPECYISSATPLPKTTSPELEEPIDFIDSEWPKNKLNELLHSACIDGDSETVMWLIENGADIEANLAEFGSRVYHPLQLAAMEGHEQTVRVLVQLGAKLEQRSSRGRTAIHEAGCRGHIAIVRALVELGADPESTDREKRTPLIAATIAGRLGTVRVLLKLGANMEHRDSSGNTALHYAVNDQSREIVQVLEESGASQWAKNNKIETPFGRIVPVPPDPRRRRPAADEWSFVLTDRITSARHPSVFTDLDWAEDSQSGEGASEEGDHS